MQFIAVGNSVSYMIIFRVAQTPLVDPGQLVEVKEREIFPSNYKQGIKTISGTDH